MAAYTSWYNEVLPEVPGCIQAVALNAIRNSAIEFLEKSGCYQYDHAAIDAVANTPTYAFVPPTGYLIAKVFQAHYNGNEIIPKTPDDLNSIYSDWKSMAGTPLFYTQDDERNIRLIPMPADNLAGALKLKVSLKPTRASTTVEDRFFEEYVEHIKYGALYRLMAQHGKPYTNNEGAQQNYSLFHAGINDVRNKVMRGFGRAAWPAVKMVF